MPVAVRIVNHIVEIRDVLLLHKIAEDVHVAVGFGIGGENVMVGDDDNFIFVPHFCGLAELTFEHADRARPANVVRHQYVGADPDIVAGLDVRLAGSPREQFFSQSHSLKTITEFRREFNCANVLAGENIRGPSSKTAARD